MTGVRFLFRVTLRRHDLAAEVWRIKEPQKLVRPPWNRPAHRRIGVPRPRPIKGRTSRMVQKALKAGFWW
jgi:hypothetical protein